MPEGHTIHRLARDHTELLVGRPVQVSSPQGRLADAAARLDGRRLEDVEAHGKHLFYDFGGGDLVHVHLGLFGKFLRHPAGPPPAPRDTVRLRMVGERGTVDLIGATECKLIDPPEGERILARLGPDPLRSDAQPDRAWAALQRRRSSIGQALMDQSVLAGVGNVYRAEVLAAHGIHPEQPANTVTRAQFDAMWATLTEWLHHAVEDQVIITVAPELIGKRRADIRPREALVVYKQDRCRSCGAEVRRWDLAGRWAYACERCQPLA